jgi:hypothetical protein
VSPVIIAVALSLFAIAVALLAIGYVLQVIAKEVVRNLFQ